MAWFCWHWRLTPDQYRSLTVAEHRAMADVLKRVSKAQRGKR